MALLPHLSEIAPGLTSIYDNLLKEPDFAQNRQSEKNLIQQALDEYDPWGILENKDVQDKLETACRLYEISWPKDKEKISADDYIVAGYGYTLLAGLYFYQGQWKEALKTIKNGQSMAVGLVKKEKSARNLFFQAEIKAFGARILLAMDEFEKAEKMFQSSFRLYKQAQKKKEQALRESICCSFQRKYLEWADIVLERGNRKQALDYYRMSAELGSKAAFKSLYDNLASLFPKESLEVELLGRLKDMNPFERLSEEEKEEYSYAEVEEALLILHLKALLLLQKPGFFDLFSFFVTLYDLIYYWYKHPSQDRSMSDSDLIALCRLLETVQNSKYYNKLCQKLWQESPVPEKCRNILEETSKAFKALIVTIQSPIKVSLEDAFELSDNPEKEVLKKLSKYFEDHSFEHDFKILSINGKEIQGPEPLKKEKKSCNRDFFDLCPVLTYLFLVAAINHNYEYNGPHAYDYTFFELCNFLMTNCHYESIEELGVFFGRQALKCIGKDNPLDWLDTYNDTIDFYTIFYHLCFLTGNDEEGYKYSEKVSRIKSELYRSGFYDQDDWMFR